MSLPVPSPRTSGNGFGYIIIGKSLIIIVVCGISSYKWSRVCGILHSLRSFWMTLCFSMSFRQRIRRIRRGISCIQVFFVHSGPVFAGFFTVVLNDIQFPTVIPRNAVTRNPMNYGLLRSRGPGFVGFFARYARSERHFVSRCHSDRESEGFDEESHECWTTPFMRSRVYGILQSLCSFRMTSCFSLSFRQRIRRIRRGISCIQVFFVHSGHVFVGFFGPLHVPRGIPAPSEWH